MYEHYRQPLLGRSDFFVRLFYCGLISFALLAATILIGAASYHSIEKLSWLDAVLNAVMVMTGLGMVTGINTPSAKLFTTFYALFSTIIFFMVLAILFSPLLHRFLHRFHLEIEKEE